MARRAIAVTASFNAYVAGSTSAYGYVATSAGALQPASSGEAAFIAEINSLGDTVAATYLSGDRNTWGEAIAVDGAGYIYVAGKTDSTTFPGGPAISPNPTAGFVSKLSPQLNALQYTTFLGADISSIALAHPTSRTSTLYSQVYTSGSRYTGGLDFSNLDAFVVKLDESPILLIK
jgi:hypothetical protein